MNHPIKVHAVCKFSYFGLWYLKASKKNPNKLNLQTVALVEEACNEWPHLGPYCLTSSC